MIKRTSIDSKEAEELSTSDLCITTEKEIIQYEYINEEENRVYEPVPVKPGIFKMCEMPGGKIALQSTDFSPGDALDSIDNTAKIKKEISTFFSKLHIYSELGLQPKRSILLFGLPGCGKTFSVKKTVEYLNNLAPDMAVLLWPTSEIGPETVSDFLSYSADYQPEVKKLMLIMEDIGGVEADEDNAPVRSGLLQLLDGAGVVFKVPTFIIATTNFPQKLLPSLANRPGRFDRLIELSPPPAEQKIALMEFIAKRVLTDDEKKAFRSEKAKDLSIAHLKEIVIRSLLDDKSYVDCIDEMDKYAKRFKKGFQEHKEMGIQSGWED